MKRQQANLPKFDWQFVAKSYLALAYIGIEEIKEKKYCNQPSFLWRVSIQVYDAKLLLIPIIWNIKHAIELILKAHLVTFQKEYPPTHDLIDLKNNLANVLEIKNQGEDEKFDELADIVDQYHKLEICNRKLIGTKTILDNDNDVLRFPEGSKANFKLNLKVFKNITDEELEGLQKDIDLINRRLTIMAKYPNLKQYWNSFSKG